MARELLERKGSSGSLADRHSEAAVVAVPSDSYHPDMHFACCFAARTFAAEVHRQSFLERVVRSCLGTRLDCLGNPEAAWRTEGAVPAAEACNAATAHLDLEDALAFLAASAGLDIAWLHIAEVDIAAAFGAAAMAKAYQSKASETASATALQDDTVSERAALAVAAGILD